MTFPATIREEEAKARRQIYASFLREAEALSRHMRDFAAQSSGAGGRELAVTSEADKYVDVAISCLKNLSADPSEPPDYVSTEAKVFAKIFSIRMVEMIQSGFMRDLVQAISDMGADDLPGVEGEACVTMASPIGRDFLISSLLAKFPGLVITERIDGNLLAGAVIRCGTLEIDGSLLSRWHDALYEVRREERQ